MKFLRLLLLAAFLLPLVGNTVDACCAVSVEDHAQAVALDACEAGTHIEAADDCCHDDPCSECTFCNAHSPSLLDARASVLIPLSHDLAPSTVSARAEIAAFVLTPPPTL